MKKRFSALCLILGLLAALCAVGPGSASLGGSVDSVEKDRRSLAAVRGAGTVGEGYEVKEMHNPAAAVREYISPSGVVFGIAWNGPVRPDLAQLLGAYAEEYEGALRRTPRQPGRPYLKVQANGLVVEQWGHVRGLHGRAYVANLVPKGVSVDAIK